MHRVSSRASLLIERIAYVLNYPRVPSGTHSISSFTPSVRPGFAAEASSRFLL